MNKKQFTKYMKSQMEGMTYEQKIRLLKRIEGNYVPDLIKSCMQKEGYYVSSSEADKYFRCKRCKKYTPKTKCKSESKTEIREETTYSDAGYGDDDMMGDVEYFVEYMICPCCHHKQEVHKLYMRKIREWNRREGRK